MASLQCGYSIAAHNNASFGFLGRTDATREYCTKNGVWYQAYSPLGGLSGVDVLGEVLGQRPAPHTALSLTPAHEQFHLGNPVVQKIATAHSVSTEQVALRWVAQQPALFVTAAENPDYMKEDLDIFGFELSEEEMVALSQI